MSFANPHLLWLLVTIPPALLLFLWWSSRERWRLMTQFIQGRLLPGLLVGVSPKREKLRAALLIVAIAFLIFAISGPQFGYELEEVQQRGLDVVVAIDTSRSMLAEDIAPNRLTRAKYAALELMQEARTDRLGLVAFAGTAFLQCPLTIDNTAFRQSVNSLDVNTLPEGGTAIAEAIETAQSAFKEGDNHRVLVLFTDGEDHDSTALEAAKKVAQNGMKIFTIGIGSAEGELLRIRNANGQSDYIRDSEGNVVKSRLNEQLLREIAGAAGGFYLPLRGAGTIDTLYEKGLAPLPKSDSLEKWVRRARERYHWPLAIALILLVAEALFPERKQDRNSKPRRSTKTTAAAHAALLTLMLIPAIAMGSPKTALADYKAGKFAAAQKEYERLAKLEKEDPGTLFFNAGTAAYKGTNYDAALKLFTSALSSPDVKLQQKAYFNIGNTKFRQGEAMQNLDGMERLWIEAVKNYENALQLDRNDRDAAHNLEFAKSSIEAVRQIREMIRQAQAAADAAVRQRNYRRALEVLQPVVEQKLAPKALEDYVNKLKEIDEIANPARP